MAERPDALGDLLANLLAGGLLAIALRALDAPAWAAVLGGWLTILGLAIADRVRRPR